MKGCDRPHENWPGPTRDGFLCQEHWEIYSSMLCTTPTTAEVEALMAQMAQMAPIFQRIANTINEACRKAMLDPEQAAKIQKIAAHLKKIRDRPRL